MNQGTLRGLTQVPNAGLIACTSLTRPARPFRGMLIYEQDTDKLLEYTTATTGWNPPWNLPWGVLARHELTSTFSTASTHTTMQDTGLTVTVSCPANRRLKVSYKFNPYGPGGSNAVFFRFLKGGVSFEWVGYPAVSISASAASQLSGAVPIDQATALSAVVIKVQMESGGTNAQVADFGDTDFKRHLIVEDVGSLGAPS